MLAPEAIVLFAILLLPFVGYIFFRRMRAIQRDRIQARHDRLSQDVLDGMEPKDREELLRSEAETTFTRPLSTVA